LKTVAKIFTKALQRELEASFCKLSFPDLANEGGM
jgi:hypothetical protein